MVRARIYTTALLYFAVTWYANMLPLQHDQRIALNALVWIGLFLGIETIIRLAYRDAVRRLANRQRAQYPTAQTFQ